jgi:hypothetical protein
MAATSRPSRFSANYMAGSFATDADGHGGTLLMQGPQTGQQPLLTHPVP